MRIKGTVLEISQGAFEFEIEGTVAEIERLPNLSKELRKSLIKIHRGE